MLPNFVSDLRWGAQLRQQVHATCWSVHLLYCCVVLYLGVSITIWRPCVFLEPHCCTVVLAAAKAVRPPPGLADLLQLSV